MGSPPKFADQTTWRLAEALMQPAFIRLIDNLRKQLETTEWEGAYHEVSVWPSHVPDDTRQRVEQLRTEWEQAAPAQRSSLEHTLAQLPQPFPGYELRLQRDTAQATLDVWELCYRLCFQDYDPTTGQSQGTTAAGVMVDMTLFDGETGEVEWNRLDEKAQRLVTQVFAEVEAAI